MPEIVAKVKADTSDFDRKLKESTKKAREFADGVKEGGTKALNSATGGIGGNLLGMAGAGAAGAAIVEGFAKIGEMLSDKVKEGIEAFKEHQQSAMHLGYKAGNPDLGNEIQEQIHAISGAGGNEAELSQAYGHLLDAGMEANEDTFDKFQRLNKIAVGSGESIESMTQGFRRAELGGLDVGEAASKLARNNPYMERLVRDEIKAHTASLATNRQGMYSAGRGAEFESEMAKWRNMTVTDYLKGGNLTSDKFWQMVGKVTDPGGIYADAIDRAKTTVAGNEAETKKAEEENKKALGEEVAPGHNDLENTKKELDKRSKGINQKIGLLTGFAEGQAARWTNTLLGLPGPKVGDVSKSSNPDTQKKIDEQTEQLKKIADFLQSVMVGNGT